MNLACSRHSYKESETLMMLPLLPPRRRKSGASGKECLELYSMMTVHTSFNAMKNAKHQGGSQRKIQKRSSGPMLDLNQKPETVLAMQSQMLSHQRELS